MRMMDVETLLGFGLPGNWEWVIIAMIALLLFGSRLPQVARSVGDGIREFKKGLKDVTDDAKEPPRRDPPRSPLPPRTSDGEDARVPHGVSAGDEER